MAAFRRTVLALALLIGLISAPVTALAAEGDIPPLLFFWGMGCPHCETEKAFLSELADDYPELEIRQFEVWYDEANRELFLAEMAERDLEARAVPTTIFGDRVWEGFDGSVGREIEAEVEAVLAGAEAPEPADPSEAITLPLIGPVEIVDTSLVTATILIALVDGVNPCSLWVLSLLLALVLRTRSRRRVLAVGGTFLLITSMLYGLYIAGMYGALSYVAGESWVRAAMAAIALGFGIINLKDYFSPGLGPSLAIPNRGKPWIYRMIRSVTTGKATLPAVLGGTAVLALGVSVLETPCTAGYPLLWADLLATREVGTGGAVPLFGLYLLVFLMDELVIFGVAVAAMRATKLEERAGRLLKLIGGTVMIALAGTLVFAPQAMETVGGALAVFLLAGAAVAIILAVERLLRLPGGKREGSVSRSGRGRPPRAAEASPRTGQPGHRR
ncbi:MAG: glutaredoxin family protein [Actinomycetota bacterium]